MGKRKKEKGKIGKNVGICIYIYIYKCARTEFYKTKIKTKYIGNKNNCMLKVKFLPLYIYIFIISIYFSKMIFPRSRCVVAFLLTLN